MIILPPSTSGVSFVSIFVNVLCDLIMVAYVARSQHLNSIFSGTGAGAIGYDQALSSELFRLIMPGYLLVPAMGGPIINFIIPFWLSFWFIRSRSGVLGRDATEALRAPDFEISWRYADILNNFCLCLTLLFFPGENGCLIMLGFGVYLILVYCLDRYLFFERATLTYHPTAKLAQSFANWFVVPSSITMLLVCYWASRAFALDWDLYTRVWFSNYLPSQIVFATAMVAVHCAFYLTLLRRMNHYFVCVGSALNMGNGGLASGGSGGSRRGAATDGGAGAEEQEERVVGGEEEEASMASDARELQTKQTRSSRHGAQKPGGLPTAAPATYYDCVARAHANSARERIRKMEARKMNQPFFGPESIDHSAVATYFNTNPVFCLRSRYLGEQVSGWKGVKNYLRVPEQECFPFLRGNYPNFWKQY